MVRSSFRNTLLVDAVQQVTITSQPCPMTTTSQKWTLWQSRLGNGWRDIFVA
jgi:hypothetical protein